MAEVAEIQKLKDELFALDPHNRTEFVRLLKASMDGLELSDTELSEAFDASRPTVNRWRNGTSAPSVAVRRLVAKDLIKRLSHRIQGKRQRASNAAAVESRQQQ